MKITGYKETSDGVILDYYYEKGPPITKTEDEINAELLLQQMNRERIYEGLYPFIRYNRGTWYEKKTSRSKWKAINNLDEVIKILHKYISKLQLVIQINLENIYATAQETANFSMFEELIHDIESILHDDSL